jgi:RNA polymerase sigma factor (sigma-70 family)
MRSHGIAMPVTGLLGLSRPDGCGEGLSDDVLAKATRAGDPDAFATLYQRHEAHVREHVARWVPFPSLHEDYTQEIFTRALAEIMSGRYRPTWTPEGFADWLTGPVADAAFTAGKRTWWTAFKAEYEVNRQARGEIFEELRAARAASEPPSGAADSMREHLAAEADADAVRTDLLAALAGLSPECRRVLELRYLDGLNIEATARVMGCEREYVRWLRQKAVGQLRTADLAPLRRPGGRREHKKARTEGIGSVFALNLGPKGQRAYRAVGELVTSGQLGPDGQLPPMRHLSQDLGVCRRVLGRVLGQLTAEGVIRSVPAKGYYAVPGGGTAPRTAGTADWAGYVWVTSSDGTQRRQWVYGRTREEAQVKWDRLHAQVTGPAGKAVA